MQGVLKHIIAVRSNLQVTEVTSPEQFEQLFSTDPLYSYWWEANEMYLKEHYENYTFNNIIFVAHNGSIIECTIAVAVQPRRTGTMIWIDYVLDRNHIEKGINDKHKTYTYNAGLAQALIYLENWLLEKYPPKKTLFISALSGSFNGGALMARAKAKLEEYGYNTSFRGSEYDSMLAERENRGSQLND